LPFIETRRVLFPEVVEVASQDSTSLSEDDPDWEGGLEDTESPEAVDEASDFDVELDVEDPLQELGMYNQEEDMSTWSFEERFSDEQWQDQSITLGHDTTNFTGPVPSPTSAVASRPAEYFLRYWPPHILQRVVHETNRYNLPHSLSHCMKML